LLLTLLVVQAGNANPAEPQVQVTVEGELYKLHVETVIAVSRELIHAALTDYDHLSRITPVITRSRLVEPDVVEIMMHGCFLVFCFDKLQTQRITVTPYDVYGEIIPEKSDYKSGWSRWQLADHAGGTAVTLDSQFVPDFWVPPLVGRYMIQRSMERQVLQSIKTLESLPSKPD
jgi:hypothetical protein